MSHQNATQESRSPDRPSKLTIILTPAPSGIGRFEARLDGEDGLLCTSRTAFLDAARQLVADGYDPNTDLVLRHAGSHTEGLKAKLGTAASLTVEETDYGPKLRRWKPFSTLAVGPRIAFQDRTAITPAPTPNEPNRVAPWGSREIVSDGGNDE